MAKPNNFHGPQKVMPKRVIKKPMNQNETINVDNSKLEELMDIYAKENNSEILNALVNELVKTRVLVPARLNERKQPLPLKIKANGSEAFFPVFSTKKHITADAKAEAVLNMPFLSVNEIARKDAETTGIVINPFTGNLVLRRALIEKIAEIEEKKAELQKAADALERGEVVEGLNLTEAQINALERVKYEHVTLTEKFFGNPESFLDTLCDRKEEYLDELFEQSYQNPRLYPYLVEEFHVMPLHITDSLLAVQVDMPTRDVYEKCCSHIFFLFDTESDMCRMFTIEKEQGKTVLAEMTKDLHRISHGDAPNEGVELQSILDLIQKA